MSDLTGVVMCGGKSMRMGTDKGLIVVGDNCWAGVVADKLRAAGLPVLVSVNATQTVGYRAFFAEDALVTDVDNIAGPLAGLFSVHQQYPDNDFLLIACDMIDVQPITIDRLIQIYNEHPDYDFYAYQNGTFLEPFCAVYTSHGLKKFINDRDSDALSGLGLQQVFKAGNTKLLQVTEPGSFANHNTVAK